MRLKFYLMGLGIGVIVAAVIMGIAMRGRTREMTDEEIMARARQLGMVEAGTLAEIQTGENEQNTEQPVETVAQAQIQEAAPAPAEEADAGSGEAAGQDGTEQDGAAGTADQARAEDGESADAADGADGTAQDQSMVVEGEPVDDEEADEPDEAGEEAAAQDASGNADTADRAESSAGGNAVGSSAQQTGGASAAGDASVTQTASAGNAASSDDAQATGSIVVTIPDGLYSEDIAALLETAGVVDNATAFNDYLVNSGNDRYITVGARLIPRGSSYEEVARIITGR